MNLFTLLIGCCWTSWLRGTSMRRHASGLIPRSQMSSCVVSGSLPTTATGRSQQSYRHKHPILPDVL